MCFNTLGLSILRELGGIRTPNLLGRNQVHYPVVLRVLWERKTNNYALKFSLLLHDSIFAEIFLRHTLII